MAYVVRNCFGCTSLCDWSKKLAPLSQPIRLRIKTNCDLATRVFPRFKHFACFSFNSHFTLSKNLFLGPSCFCSSRSKSTPQGLRTDFQQLCHSVLDADFAFYTTTINNLRTSKQHLTSRVNSQKLTQKFPTS